MHLVANYKVTRYFSPRTIIVWFEVLICLKKRSKYDKHCKNPREDVVEAKKTEVCNTAGLKFRKVGVMQYSNLPEKVAQLKN